MKKHTKKPKSFIHNNALHTLQFKGRINIKFVKECVNCIYVFVTSYKTLEEEEMTHQNLHSDSDSKCKISLLFGCSFERPKTQNHE